MSNSASGVGLEKISLKVSEHSSFSKLKTCGLTIAVIVGISGLALGSVGLAGYCHVGSLSNMVQLDAIIMMATGSGSGAILLIIGLVGTIKNRHDANCQRYNRASSSSRDIGAHSAISIASTVAVNLSSLFIYGPEAWKKWKNVDILDVVPPVPTAVDLSKKDKILFYMPYLVVFNGKKQPFDLKTLQEIAGYSFYLSPSIEKQFGKVAKPGGWILIDKTVPVVSMGKNYATLQKMAEARGCSMPSALEAAALNLIVFGLTGEKLYGQKPWAYTYCLEKVDGQYPVVVGGFGSEGILNVDERNGSGGLDSGVACVRRKF